MFSSVTLALEPNVPERFVEHRAMCHPEKLTHGQQDTVHLRDRYTVHRNSRRDSRGTSEAERTSPWAEALCQRQQPKAPSLDEEDNDEPLPSAQLLGFLAKTRMYCEGMKLSLEACALHKSCWEERPISVLSERPRLFSWRPSTPEHTFPSSIPSLTHTLVTPNPFREPHRVFCGR